MQQLTLFLKYNSFDVYTVICGMAKLSFKNELSFMSYQRFKKGGRVRKKAFLEKSAQK